MNNKFNSLFLILFIFLLVTSCTGTEEEWLSLKLKECGETSGNIYPSQCGGAPTILKIVESNSILIADNQEEVINILESFIIDYSVKNANDEDLIQISMRKGLDLFIPYFHNYISFSPQISNYFYNKSRLLKNLNDQNFEIFGITKDMKLFLSGNGYNPQLFNNIAEDNWDILLEYLKKKQSLTNISLLFIKTNILSDPKYFTELIPYLDCYLVCPFDNNQHVSIRSIANIMAPHLLKTIHSSGQKNFIPDACFDQDFKL